MRLACTAPGHQLGFLCWPAQIKAIGLADVAPIIVQGTSSLTALHHPLLLHCQRWHQLSSRAHLGMAGIAQMRAMAGVTMLVRRLLGNGCLAQLPGQLLLK